MVQPDELLRLLRQRPFQPFRVSLSDGRVYDIRYPEINLVGKTFFGIGIPMPDQEDPFGDYGVTVPLDVITGVDLLTAPASSPQP
jgi:hypothetical protein